MGINFFDHNTLVAQKNGAYSERNALVAFLSKLYPSHLARHDENDISWDDEWRWIVCVHAGTGLQMTWHIHDSEYPNFSHLIRSTEHKIGDEGIFFLAPNDWDGHSTEEKYRRLSVLGDVLLAKQELIPNLTLDK